VCNPAIKETTAQDIIVPSLLGKPYKLLNEQFGDKHLFDIFHLAKVPTGKNITQLKGTPVGQIIFSSSYSEAMAEITF